MLGRCLDALAAQDLPGGLEIIVVDDGSTDASAEVARSRAARVVRIDPAGPAAARNRGAAEATADILLFTDADCVPAPDWARRMCEPFGDPRVCAVKGVYETAQRSLTARFAQAEFEDRYRILSRHEEIQMVDTYAAAFLRRIFLEAGGFDPSFPVASNEDTELSYRLAASGHRMVFAPAAVVEHTHPATPLAYLRAKFWRGYWRMEAYRRHPRRMISDTYTPQLLKFQILLAAAISASASASLLWSQAVWGLAGLASCFFVSALPFAMRTLRRDPVVALISPAYLFGRSLAFGLGIALWLCQGGALRPPCSPPQKKEHEGTGPSCS